MPLVVTKAGVGDPTVGCLFGFLSPVGFAVRFVVRFAVRSVVTLRP
jgi:hypothetical protein